MDKLKDLVGDCIAKLKNEKSCIAIKGNKKDFNCIKAKFLEHLKEDITIVNQKEFDLDEFLKTNKKIIIYGKEVYDILRKRWANGIDAFSIPGIEIEDDINMRKVYFIDLDSVLNSKRDYYYISYYNT